MSMPNSQETTQPSSHHRPAHVLSNRSILQNRDVFFFYDMGEKTFELCGGLDSTRHNVSIKTCYRWLGMVDNAPPVDFHLWPVKIERYDIFAYAVMREGSPLPQGSTDPLPPGDYAAYYLGESSTEGEIAADDSEGDSEYDKYVGIPIGPGIYYVSFTERQKALEDRGKKRPQALEPLQHNKFTKEMESDVEARDGGVCFIQGNNINPTKIIWLVPPLLADEASLESEDDRDEREILIEQHKNLDNIISLDESLHHPFMENKFGIDVEDDYKIVVFQDFPGSEKLSSLPPTSIHSLTGKACLYLRENFKYCLGVNLLGGDIAEDYPDRGREFILDIAENGYGSPTDEKWKSAIGQEFLDYYKDRLPTDFLHLLK